MAWQTVMTTMVRHLINDLDVSPKYPDSRIQEAIVVAGLIVSQEYPFSTGYTFDIGTPDISPDPTVSATLDNLAVALFGLKAACILSLNSYQGAISTGIKVRDGDSEVDTTGSFKGYADIIQNGPCGAYQKLLRTSQFGRSIGKAVVSPSTITDGQVWGRDSIASFFDHLRG